MFTKHPDWRLVKQWGDANPRDFGMMCERNCLKYYEFDKEKCEKHGIEYKEGRFYGIDPDSIPSKLGAVTRDENHIVTVDYSKLVPYLLMKISVLESRMRR